jgi:hypothetical protein
LLALSILKDNSNLYGKGVTVGPEFQTGVAFALQTNNTNNKNEANSFFAFTLSVFLISEVVDVAMSGCFG